MAYTPTVYDNDNPPAVNASNLNKSEQGIKDAHDGISDLTNKVNLRAPLGAIGFNIWDEEWEVYGSGSSARIGSKNYIPVNAETTYYMQSPQQPSYGLKFYDKNLNVLSTRYNAYVFVTPANCAYISFQLNNNYGTTYNHDICINISQPDLTMSPHNGDYVPYGDLGIYGEVLDSKKNIEVLKNSIVIYIRGLGTKGGGNSGVTGVGQYYVHSSERKLKRVVSYTSTTSFTDEIVAFSINPVYVYNGELYKYSGSNDFDGLISLQTNEITDTPVIYIRGVGTKVGGNSGVTGVGQYYVHSDERKLKYIVSYTSSTNFTDKTIAFSIDPVYVYDGELYKYSGSNNFDGLIKISPEIQHITDETLDSYVYQVMNVLNYIGENHFYERILTVAEANAYVSWPIISYDEDGNLICVYARGNSHTDIHSGAYYKTSPNGIIWAAEKMLLDTTKRENVTGKGHDVNGNALFWIRIGNNFNLYKYANGEFSVISSGITVGAFAHIGDIILAEDGVLISFWNDYQTQRSYGIVKSTDNGVTWNIITFPAEESNSEVPTETQGVYLGNGKILAIGRKDIGGGTNAQMQFQSEDNGLTWSKEYTNITDIGSSTTSMVYDSVSGEVYAYYYNRTTGKLLMRHCQVTDVWDNPTNWPASEQVLSGGTGQDAGNVNVVPLNGKHYITYYSGNSAKTGVYDYIEIPSV